MSRNLLAARYGTDRANQKIRQQLTDSLMSAYNQVAYTPRNEHLLHYLLLKYPLLITTVTTPMICGGAFSAVSNGFSMFAGRRWW